MIILRACFHGNGDLSTKITPIQKRKRPVILVIPSSKFTQTDLGASVFVLKRFFCQMQCFDWAISEPNTTTHFIL